MTRIVQRAVHPGALLKDELEEVGISASEFARQIGVPHNRVTEIIKGRRAITGDTALRFGHWFDTDPKFWMNLQSQFDLAAAAEDKGSQIAALPTREAFTDQRDGVSTG